MLLCVIIVLAGNEGCTVGCGLCCPWVPWLGTVDCVGVGSFLVGLMCAGLVRIRVLVIIEFVLCGYDAAVALRCMLLTVAVMLTVSRIFRSRFRNPKLIWDFMFPFPKTLRIISLLLRKSSLVTNGCA